ncbi:hypothetical protein Tco_1386114 [Tanacetum coccineum]
MDWSPQCNDFLVRVSCDDDVGDVNIVEPMLVMVIFKKTTESVIKKEDMAERKHDLISHLKLKGFSSYVCVALLTITGSLNTALDLNNLLSCLMDDLWASELTISNFSPADR